MDYRDMKQITEFISAQTGLQLQKGNYETLTKAVDAGMRRRNLSSPEEYLQLLKVPSQQSRLELQQLSGLLTVGESYFFRDKGQFSLLRSIVLPELIKRKAPQRSLSIWSAGCSTGEEPYSLAILAHELIPDRDAWDILILGTDMNEAALEKARRGVYSQWSFRMVEPEIQSRYFKRRNDSWELDEEIRRMVKFRAGNLIEDKFSGPASEMHNLDIVLCRNVFIYMNTLSVALVLEKFVESLNEGGWLITGHGELYGQKPGKLQAKMFPESVAYRKMSAERGVERKT